MKPNQEMSFRAHLHGIYVGLRMILAYRLLDWTLNVLPMQEDKEADFLAQAIGEALIAMKDRVVNARS